MGDTRQHQFHVVGSDNLDHIESFRGKRSDPGWNQITAYIRRETHIHAKIALVDSDCDLSDLLEHLLSAWLDRRKVPQYSSRIRPGSAGGMFRRGAARAASLKR